MIPGERRLFAGKRNYRRNDLREVADKAAVEVAESDESLNVGQTGRRSLIADGLNLFGVYADTISADNHPKKLGLGHEELALRHLGEEPGIS
jgi:hypothetical protein